MTTYLPINYHPILSGILYYSYTADLQRQTYGITERKNILTTYATQIRECLPTYPLGSNVGWDGMRWTLRTCHAARKKHVSGERPVWVDVHAVSCLA